MATSRHDPSNAETLRMSTLQARHRGHNIPDGVTTFNEIEYDREGGVFLNRTKIVLLVIIVFLLTAFSAFLGRYTAERQLRQYIYRDSFVKKAESGVADNQIPFLAVEPESYKVFLDPKLYDADGTVSKHDVDYSGRVEVIFRPKTDTSVISLHIGNLKIDDDTMLKRRLSMDTPTEQVLKDDSKYELNTEVDEKQETLTVTVGETLKSGHYYSLFVNFTGTIGQNPDGGFFKVVFDKKKAVKNQWYVATKLAPRKARHLMPCVDNPKHKAIFEMSVVRSKDTKVIFNTQVRATEPYNDNLFVDHFEKTGLIRPDSLGLFMSNFKSNPIPTDSSLELTVWSPDSTDSIEMITDVVPKTLDFMTSYLATNFPTNKLDIVVVPGEVMTTAESPGLIMIKDSILGTIDKSSIIEYQKSVESMVVHVIRQWLMPLRGLDRGSNEDKWLNEAIVNFLKIVNIDHIKPAWNFGTRFPLDTIQPVMFYDSWTNSEPLANYEHHTEIYKYINSVKGTSILRMLNNTFTESIFKQTLREFVHTEIYKYKDTISFWTLLDDNARNKSIKLPESSAVLQIVNTWMKNKNYPLIKLQIDGDDLVVKQFRFDYDEPKPTNDWVIPITLTSGAAYSTTVWLENNPETRVPGYISASNGTWILVNQYQTGYYRVAYEDALLDRISYEISNGKSFDEYIVAQLIDDIFEGAFAGVIGFSDALGFLERVIQKAGPNSGYWDAIFNAFNKIEVVLHNTKHYDSLSVYMETVVEKAYDMFQASTIDSPDKILGKMDTSYFAGRVELKKCVWWAREQFNNWKQATTEINPIAPNDRKSVYCTAMQYATKYDHRFMLSKYASSKWTLDRKSIAKSFSCSRNSQFLQKILSAEEVKFDDLADIWQSILDNPTAGQYPFNYLRNNWETLNQEYADTNVGLLSTMLHAGIRALNSLADLEILQSFNEKYFGNTVENRNPTLLEVLHFEEEILRQKIIWKEKYENVISSWITPKAAKSDLRAYNIDGGLKSKTENVKRESDDIKSDKEKLSDTGSVKTEETKQENITPPKTDASEADRPVIEETSKNLLGEKPEPAAMIATNESAPPAVTVAAGESAPAAVEQIKPIAAEETKTAADEIKPAAEENKPNAEETNKPTAVAAAETNSMSATAEVEKLAGPANLTEARESALVGGGLENKANSPDQQTPEEKKPEPVRKSRSKKNKILTRE
ncbi:aminopeptidase N-like isoform X1 [Rhopalosiphum maidis]|uniref:aminopeptidase N-like isoform X1 n=1 Tax=Rhopalosiphum maidis TaxID=43146 RepID=UPI000F0085B6|nr:aminopeptidase N-like isoform X1 [Rhopalosiphum maidis]